MHKVLRSKKERFFNVLKNINNAVVIAFPSLSKFSLEKFNPLVKKNGFKSVVTLKRLFHKLYVGPRGKNEKISDYTRNLHLLVPGDNANFQVINRLKGYDGKILGVLHNQKFERNYAIYLKSKFNSNLAAALLLKKLLTIVAIAIKNSKILNKEQ